MTKYKGFELGYVPSTALNHKGVNVWLGLNHHDDKYIGVEFGKTFASYDVFRDFPREIIDHLCKKAIDDNIENYSEGEQFAITVKFSDDFVNGCLSMLKFGGI